MKKRRAAGAWATAQSQLSASTLHFCTCPGTCFWRAKKKASGHLAETGKDAALPQLFLLLRAPSTGRRQHASTCFRACWVTRARAPGPALERAGPQASA